MITEHRKHKCKYFTTVFESCKCRLHEEGKLLPTKNFGKVFQFALQESSTTVTAKGPTEQTLTYVHYISSACLEG